MVLRRRSKASRILATASRSPETAARAAAWATLETFDVACDCRFVAALTTSFGPMTQPTRQPVMAYVLATPLTTTHLSRSSGSSAGRDTADASP